MINYKPYIDNIESTADKVEKTDNPVSSPKDSDRVDKNQLRIERVPDEEELNKGVVVVNFATTVQ